MSPIPELELVVLGQISLSLSSHERETHMHAQGQGPRGGPQPLKVQFPTPPLWNGNPAFFFPFPLQVPKIGFRREVSKQLSHRKGYSLPLLGQAEPGSERGWGVWTPATQFLWQRNAVREDPCGWGVGWGLWHVPWR